MLGTCPPHCHVEVWGIDDNAGWKFKFTTKLPVQAALTVTLPGKQPHKVLSANFKEVNSRGNDPR